MKLGPIDFLEAKDLTIVLRFEMSSCLHFFKIFHQTVFLRLYKTLYKCDIISHIKMKRQVWKRFFQVRTASFPRFWRNHP
jgi:hypothetical protein